MISDYSTKNSITKEEIQQSITDCLKEVDPRYYDSSFNLIEEIINVFGELNFDKVKLNIDSLAQVTNKLDQSIKLIITKHSDEFFQILGFVREMNKTLKASKEQYSFAEISLDTLISIISSLIAGENNEWKLKSIFFSEVLSKLRKTQSIYELLQNCDTFLQFDKIFEAIDLLINGEEEHQLFDKEFRQFNLLVNVNLRFNKINGDIIYRLSHYLNAVLLFNEGNCLKKKIDSLIDYFLSSYAKVSIDLEVTQPLIRFINIISHTVEYSLKDLAIEEQGNNNTEPLKTMEAKLNPCSLAYLIQCLKRYSNPLVLSKYAEDFPRNLSQMMTNIIKAFSDDYELIYQNVIKVDLNDKTDKIIFLMLIQVPLLICYHTLTKLKAITQMTTSFSKEKAIFNAIEAILVLPLKIIQRVVCYSFQLNDIQGEGMRKDDDGLANGLYQIEMLYKRKLNEMSFITFECLPIAYKIYNDFYSQCLDKLGISFTSMKATLTEYSSQLYQYLEVKLCPKKFFDVNSFIFEYDADSSNFKFINEITKAINQLKRLTIFASGDDFFNIMRIAKALFLKLFEDTKLFIEKQKKDCIHKTLYINLYAFLIKFKHEVVAKVLIDFQYRKYEKQIIKKMGIDNKENSKVESISASLAEFVIEVALTTKQPDQLPLLNRNYKLIELLTKFIACTEAALVINENFIFDIIKQALPEGKVEVLLEQVGQIAFESIGSEKKNDLNALILSTLTTFDNMSYCLFQILLLLRIEFDALVIPLVKNLAMKNYALKEPETMPEYFVTSFVNDLLMYNSLFQYNLNEVEYAFVKEDYMKIINEIFLNFLQSIDVIRINHYGINLLIKNFEYIRCKLGNAYGFGDKHIEETVKYFVNYARLVNLNEEQFNEQLSAYYKAEPYKEDEIAQIMLLRSTNQRVVNRKEMNAMILKGFI